MKLRKLFTTISLIGVTLIAAGCGNKSKTGLDGESLVGDYNNYVYKAEDLAGFDGSTDYSIYMAGDKIYQVFFEYDYGDEYDMEIEPRTLDSTVDTSTDDAVADDTATNEANESSSEDAAATTDSPNMAITEDGTTTETEAEGDIIIDDGYGYGSEGKFTLTVKCIDNSGKEIYNYAKEYPLNCSIYNFAGDKAGALYYIKSEYDQNEEAEVYELGCIGNDGKDSWQTKLQSKAGGIDYYYPCGTVINDKGINIISNCGVETVSTSGKSSGLKAAKKSMDNISSIIQLRDGRVAIVSYGEQDPEIVELNLDTVEFGEKFTIPFQIYNYNTITSGNIHDMILTDSSGLYYYNIGDTEVHKILDYVASDLCVSYIGNIYEKDEKTVIGSYYDEFDNKTRLAIFNKVDPEKVANRKTLSVGGTWISSEVRKQAIEFNRSNEEYRIVLVNYSELYAGQDWNEMIKKVNNDVVTGKLPDIMICDSSLNINNYASKGVFAPLDSYFEDDSVIKREDYLDNVLNALSYNGKLYYIAPSFSIRTAIVKKSLVGDKTGWNMAEFTQFADSLKEGTAVFDLLSKEDFVSNIMYYNNDTFIDKNTGKANFDSQEFIDVLKFTDRLPNTIDYEKLDQEGYWNNYDTLFREDRAAVQISNIYDFREAYNNGVTYFGTPINYIGFPTASGTGNAITFDSVMAISAKTKYKDAAWDFIKQNITDEAQDKLEYTLPVKKSSLEKKAKEAMKEQVDSETGIMYRQKVWVGGMEIEVEPPTQADIDQIMNVITSADKVANYSEDVINIIKEDAASYYNGQKSAEEVAKTIQNRVQVYVNENR